MNKLNKSNILKSGEEWHLNACTSQKKNFENYYEGYQVAAEELIDIAQNGHGCIDSLIFPIIFLTCHSIEVELKSLIWKGLYLSSKKNETPPCTHDLVQPIPKTLGQ